MADDQRLFAEGVMSLLGSDGRIDVVGHARDGREAVELAESLRPDLVLMDVAMPGIDGVEATRRVLADAPGTVVVLCSTYQPSDLPDGATDCGAAVYVRKEDLAPALLADVYRRASRPGAAGQG